MTENLTVNSVLWSFCSLFFESKSVCFHPAVSCLNRWKSTKTRFSGGFKWWMSWGKTDSALRLATHSSGFCCSTQPERRSPSIYLGFFFSQSCERQKKPFVYFQWVGIEAEISETNVLKLWTNEIQTVSVAEHQWRWGNHSCDLGELTLKKKPNLDPPFNHSWWIVCKSSKDLSAELQLWADLLSSSMRDASACRCAELNDSTVFSVCRSGIIFRRLHKIL